ncbi:sensor histidine kinase [Hansschlegelia zhihuaiae]|uniref:Sensor histidine kinase n=1 Tax=Hansschlegelia zhihuaiae TaxID=405005 RepID=A0A4Q0MHR7_9HYPH|nr:sensor histidine kinase [Hansschlegelia zhihuaiae]RXF72984.1 sensor histidine kinase [Hansschlegelia zhihuaiae]
MTAANADDGAASTPRSGLDLKWTLVRRIVVMALLCVTGGAGFALHDVAVEAGRQNQEVAVAVERHLSVQLIRIGRGLDLIERFPDWDAVLKFALRPGQCVQLIGAEGEVRNSSCAGIDERAPTAPPWFERVYRALFFDRSLAERTVLYRGEPKGLIRATIDPATVAERAWSDLSRMLGLWAMMIGALCALVYFVVDHALRPTAGILAGINRVAEGDLSTRLPAFRLRELQRISQVFNDLTQKLQATTSDRAEFARKLVDAQERERRLIARELHDDVAQRLTALNCLARSIGKSVGAAAPEASRESDELVAMASGAMRSLRDTLTYLRPPEIDDLGLVSSLQELVAGHDRQAPGATRFTFRSEGAFEDVPAEACAHIYRIIQEGLNNASRHAGADNVAVTLSEGAAGPSGDRGSGRIHLLIADDGVGSGREPGRGPLAGVGLIGMRERVYALSGEFSAGPGPDRGFELRVSFPVRLEAREAA